MEFSILGGFNGSLLRSCHKVSNLVLVKQFNLR